jgi:arylsulfatase A-like enzyme/Tfp pilus assembly protein PilF
MKQFPRPILEIIFLALVLFSGIAGAASGKGYSFLPGETKKPNLLIITVDTLRADHLGFYGHKNIKTPNIDRLAKAGVLFSQAFSHVPLTLPSHCSLFTGTLPVYHGVRNNGYRLPSFNATLAEIMKKNGYRTAAFIGAFPLDSRFGLNRGFDVYNDFYGSKNIVRDLTFVERKAEEVNEKALAWISANKNKPFFVWIHYFDPHAPYEPPPPFDQEYVGREYDGEIAYTDQTIGKLLEGIDQTHLADHTLIILTSDHGEGLGEHGESTHGIFVYDSTLKVPLLFYNLKIFPKPRIIDSLIGLIDVMPTILDVMEIKLDSALPGHSFRKEMFGSSPSASNYSYIESVAGLMERNWAPLQGIRTSEWKYIDAPIAELYDLKNDPGEEANVIEKHPEMVSRFKTMLQDMINIQSSPASSLIFKSEVDKNTQEKLRSLGYISGGQKLEETDRPDPKTMIELDNLFNDAIIASESGKMAMAETLYKQVLEKQPDFVIGYEYAAYNFYKTGMIHKGIDLLERAVSQNVISASLLARLGLYYQEAGQLEESIRVLEQSIQMDEDYADAPNFLGVSYFKSGQITKAIASFQKAIDLDNNDAMAMNNLGNCYLELQKYELALKEFRKAIAVDERLASAYNGMAVTLYRQGLANEALLNWEKSVTIEPRQTETLYNLGRIYLKMNRKQKALHFLKLFLENASPLKYAKDIEEVNAVVKKLEEEVRQNNTRE